MPSDHDTLLTETIARHFPGARISENDIDLGFGGLHMTCRVNGVQEIGSFQTAHLYFTLRGGVLGEQPIFASVSGYDPSERQAIIVGACNWACTFGPVLRAGLGGEELAEVERFEVVLDGRRFRVFIDGLDRSMMFGESLEVESRVAAARRRLGGSPWLIPRVLESGRLPLLPLDRPSLLSVFVYDLPDKRLLEVKVNGCDWPCAVPRIAEAAPEPPGGGSLLRELAVLVPIEPAPALSREPIVRTLQGLARTLGDGDRRPVAWPGWRAHGGVLAPPLSRAAVEDIENDLGVLPEDYRAFLLDVAAGGAGPGYGLRPPNGEAQRRLSRGTPTWVDGDEPQSDPAGVIVLAHAGCGVVWLLVVRGPRRGEVWIDARGSDGRARRVAPSFGAWYREWLDSAIRGFGPWCPWDTECCATVSVFAQALEGLKKDGYEGEAARARMRELKLSISIKSGGSSYFERGALLDPCHSCCLWAESFGFDDAVFKRASAAESPAANVPSSPKGWLARLRGLFR